MSETFLTPRGRPMRWEEHFVKSEDDLPALAYLIEGAAEVAADDDRLREKFVAKYRAEAARWPSDVPLYVNVRVPAFALAGVLYTDHATAFYVLADHREVMERAFEAEAQTVALCVECAAAAGADYVFGAINGLELYSPAVWERYFIPEARALHDLAHSLGMRCWVHTCGHMNRLIAMGAYEALDADILESLSHPPLGDVEDLRQDRASLGDGVVTRGAVNVGLFYSEDLDQVRERTRYVLEQTRGYRHMMGDTNGSYPPYPRDNILAMVDELHRSGRMFSPGAGK